VVINLDNFQALGISAKLSAALKSQGITEPTPVQERVIPIVLNKRDVIAQAQTGTGKTFAFVLPILEMINPQKGDIQALILTPTRELALQITAEVKKMLKSVEGVNVLAVYGGQDVVQQMRKLKGGRQIVVATPGRLLDHLRRETLTLSKVAMLVLDEADQMLHMGFLSDVEEILHKIPSKRQTMLFSATMPQQIKKLVAKYMRSPEEIRIKGTQITLDEIKQIVVETTDRAKQATLFALLDQHRPYLALIFCRTKLRAIKLNSELQENGYDSDELHGDLSQGKREQVMKRFREAKLQFLVATDVAARGLDVEGVTHIYNYDIPHDAESYIHRIGRTGRAGGEGIAVTLVAPKDQRYLELIEKGIKATLKKSRTESQQDKKPAGEKKTVQDDKDKNPRFKRGVKTEKTSTPRKSTGKTNTTRTSNAKTNTTQKDTIKKDRFKAKPTSWAKAGKKGHGTKGQQKTSRSR